MTKQSPSTRPKTPLIVLGLVLLATVLALQIKIFITADENYMSVLARLTGRPKAIKQLKSHNPAERAKGIIQLADAEHYRTIYLEPAYNALRSDPSDEVKNTVVSKLVELLNSPSLPDATRLEILKNLLIFQDDKTDNSEDKIHIMSHILVFLEANKNTALGANALKLVYPYIKLGIENDLEMPPHGVLETFWEWVWSF
jgi:hypothetical protein